MTASPTIELPVAAEYAARALDAHDDYSVLRRLRPLERVMQGGLRPGMMAGCAIGVATTGPDHRVDEVVELALQRFVMDADGRIAMVGRLHVWLEQPSQPIPAEASRMTGIRDEDVAGRRIAEGEATCMIVDSHFVIAHDAAFHRPFVECRLPAAAGRPWVCSMSDVDWRRLGFDGVSLSQLLMRMGWFHDGRRASSEVVALLRLLDHAPAADGTILERAVHCASRETRAVDAVGAPFEAKELLKGRGYRWDADARLWSREVAQPDLDDEFAWASIEVYGGLSEPLVRPVTWRDRHAARTMRLLGPVAPRWPW